jgi:hypothetical protein
MFKPILLATRIKKSQRFGVLWVDVGRRRDRLDREIVSVNLAM